MLPPSSDLVAPDPIIPHLNFLTVEKIRSLQSDVVKLDLDIIKDCQADISTLFSEKMWVFFLHYVFKYSGESSRKEKKRKGRKRKKERKE